MNITTKYEVGQSVLIIVENEIKPIDILGIQIKVSKVNGISIPIIKYEFCFYDSCKESDVYANFQEIIDKFNPLTNEQETIIE